MLEKGGYNDQLQYNKSVTHDRDQEFHNILNLGNNNTHARHILNPKNKDYVNISATKTKSKIFQR
jgi:hypothetical protein